jgi:hypothetical protein
VYDKCDRHFQVVPKKGDKKAIYDKLAGAILAKNVKANYWEEMSKIRKKQMEAFANGLVCKMKTRRNIVNKSIVMESCLKKSKKIIANVIKENVKLSICERRKGIQRKWEMIVKLESKKCFSIVELCVTIRRIWSDNIKRAGDGRIKYIRDKLEKERIEAPKRRIKRLRQKCRMLFKKRSMENMTRHLKQAKVSLECSEIWNMFEEQIGQNDVGKIMKY